MAEFFVKPRSTHRLQSLDASSSGYNAFATGVAVVFVSAVVAVREVGLDEGRFVILFVSIAGSAVR